MTSRDQMSLSNRLGFVLNGMNWLTTNGPQIEFVSVVQLFICGMRETLWGNH